MEDSILRRVDKNPNMAGIGEIGLGSANGGMGFGAGLEGVIDGRFRVVYLLGPGLLGHGAPENLIREALGKAEVVILHATSPCPEMDYASVVFPAATFVEKEGTFTNYQRRVQKIAKAYEPPNGAREELQVLLDLLKALGAGLPAADAAGVMDLLAGEVPAFKGLSYGSIPPTGALLALDH